MKLRVRDPEQPCLCSHYCWLLRRDFTLVLYKTGWSSSRILQDERIHNKAVSDCSCTYTWYWAAVASGQQEIPSDHHCSYLLFYLHVFVCVCVCRRMESSSSRGCWTSTGVYVDPSGFRCTMTMKDSVSTGNHLIQPDTDVLMLAL